MNHASLTGLTAATHTPFHADGSLNLAVVELQAEHMLANKVHSIFIAGSTGESHSLALTERQALTQRWLEVVCNTSLRVIVHVGSNCLSDAKVLAALALGAKGAVGSSFIFAAPIYLRLIAAFERGDLVTAREEQFRSVQIIQLLTSYGYMGAAKAVLGMLGVPVGPARLPNGNLSSKQVTELQKALDSMDFFNWVKR